MHVYAWCNSPLLTHLINTSYVAVRIPKLYKITKVVSLKLHSICGGSMSREESYELVLLTLALHDIGKACSGYQSTVKERDGRCNASFKYHEIIGASMIAEALSNLIDVHNVVKYVITIAVLNHHYVFRTHDSYKVIKDNIMNYAGDVLREELVEVLKTLGQGLGLSTRSASYVLGEIRNVLTSEGDVNVKTPKYINYLIAGILRKEGGYNYLASSKDDGSVHSIVSTLTGLVNISDSISAYCERRGSNGRNIFVEGVLKELNISSCSEVLKG